ncbi:hypothetical protein Sjap_025810 [Stephania japonica]|uniref:Uncharacterized protein n=1 Tax=Stephania japonica TaxID=461633 RepID=A0AAP0E2G1_9MAGN
MIPGSALVALTISFSSTVFPAILCAYAGQAAYLTKFQGIKTLEKQVQLCELSRALAVSYS